jgi:hypothetical protein
VGLPALIIGDDIVSTIVEKMLSDTPQTATAGDVKVSENKDHEKLTESASNLPSKSCVASTKHMWGSK